MYTYHRRKQPGVVFGLIIDMTVEPFVEADELLCSSDGKCFALD